MGVGFLTLVYTGGPRSHPVQCFVRLIKLVECRATGYTKNANFVFIVRIQHELRVTSGYHVTKPGATVEINSQHNVGKGGGRVKKVESTVSTHVRTCTVSVSGVREGIGGGRSRDRRCKQPELVIDLSSMSTWLTKRIWIQFNLTFYKSC